MAQIHLLARGNGKVSNAQAQAIAEAAAQLWASCADAGVFLSGWVEPIYDPVVETVPAPDVPDVADAPVEDVPA